ncbi:MAG: hypothetical protein ACYTAF_16675, partial [Planctomycetota bacterium]
AYSRYVARPERLWGLIGQARAAIRTQRLPEARRLYERAVELYEKNRKTYDEDMFAGLGGEHWPAYLDTLRRELLRAESG